MVAPAYIFASDGTEELRQALAKRMPQVQITQVNTTPVEGLYQVIAGPQVVYMTRDARYMVDGSLIDLSTKKNFTEDALAGYRLSHISSLGEENMVIYEPKDVKHTVTVITDIDCPYCRRLHSEMDQYMASGIKVRYIFMPLKGRKDLQTTVTVWCSEDRNSALDLAKAGVELDPIKCDNPIDQHLILARAIGVRGTPAIILEDGTMLPGYVPVKELAVELDKVSVSAATAKR